MSESSTILFSASPSIPTSHVPSVSQPIPIVRPSGSISSANRGDGISSACSGSANRGDGTVPTVGGDPRSGAGIGRADTLQDDDGLDSPSSRFGLLPPSNTPNQPSMANMSNMTEKAKLSSDNEELNALSELNQDMIEKATRQMYEQMSKSFQSDPSESTNPNNNSTSVPSSSIPLTNMPLSNIVTSSMLAPMNSATNSAMNSTTVPSKKLVATIPTPLPADVEDIVDDETESVSDPDSEIDRYSDEWEKDEKDEREERNDDEEDDEEDEEEDDEEDDEEEEEDDDDVEDRKSSSSSSQSSSADDVQNSDDENEARIARIARQASHVMVSSAKKNNRKERQIKYRREDGAEVTVEDADAVDRANILQQDGTFHMLHNANWNGVRLIRSINNGKRYTEATPDDEDDSKSKNVKVQNVRKIKIPEKSSRKIVNSVGGKQSQIRPKMNGSMSTLAY